MQNLWFIGAIVFDGSLEHEDRLTKTMDFAVAGDWRASVVDYFTQECNGGHYDGTEILISVFSWAGEGEPALTDLDSDSLIFSTLIVNPYITR